MASEWSQNLIHWIHKTQHVKNRPHTGKRRNSTKIFLHKNATKLEWIRLSKYILLRWEMFSTTNPSINKPEKKALKTKLPSKNYFEKYMCWSTILILGATAATAATATTTTNGKPKPRSCWKEKNASMFDESVLKIKYRHVQLMALSCAMLCNARNGKRHYMSFYIIAFSFPDENQFWTFCRCSISRLQFCGKHYANTKYPT